MLYNSAFQIPLEPESWGAPPPPTLPPLFPSANSNAYAYPARSFTEPSRKFSADVSTHQRLPYTPPSSTAPAGAQPAAAFFARSSNQMNNDTTDPSQGFPGKSGSPERRGSEKRSSVISLMGNKMQHGYCPPPPPPPPSLPFFQSQGSPTQATESPFAMNSGRTYAAPLQQPQCIAGYDVTRPIDLSSPPRYFVEPIDSDDEPPYPHNATHDLCFPPSPAHKPQYSPVVDLLQPFEFDPEQHVNLHSIPEQIGNAPGQSLNFHTRNSEYHRSHGYRRGSNHSTPPATKTIAANTTIVSPQPQRKFITSTNGSPTLGISGLHLDGSPTLSPAKTLAASASEADERFWGYLLDHGEAPPAPTGLLKRFLRGIAGYLIDSIAPEHSLVIPPSKMETFYLSLEAYPSIPADHSNLASFFLSSIDNPRALSRLYNYLNIPYLLLPCFSHKSAPIPALTPEGFEKWIMLQILLNPERQAAIFNKLLETAEIKDPETGNRFPRNFPRQALPDSADDEVDRIWGEMFSPLRIEDWGEAEKSMDEMETENLALKKKITALERELRKLRDSSADESSDESRRGSLTSAPSCPSSYSRRSSTPESKTTDSEVASGQGQGAMEMQTAEDRIIE